MFDKNSGQKDNNPLYGKIDERTKAVVYQGDAYTGRFMLFAVLFDVFLRGFKIFEPMTSSNWDLMAIVIIGSLISTVYQIRNKVAFTPPFQKSIMFLLLIVIISAVAAVLAMNFMGR